LVEYKEDRVLVEYKEDIVIISSIYTLFSSWHSCQIDQQSLTKTIFDIFRATPSPIQKGNNPPKISYILFSKIQVLYCCG
jgi:hypothetical protein